MRILVTAGNTQVAIDRVRCITNIFSGRTGTRIALHGHDRGHTVTLLTSHPEIIAQLRPNGPPLLERWTVHPYRTFEDLHDRLEEALQRPGLDVIIHCAAVSDYRTAGVYAPTPATRFHEESGHWTSNDSEPPALRDRGAGKVKSDEPELWLRLRRTPKLIDQIRTDWGFRGLLVKFKLEVGVEDARLLTIAELSRRQSGADLMVANTLEGASSWAYLGPLNGAYQRVGRDDLAARLFDAVEGLLKGRVHG